MIINICVVCGNTMNMNNRGDTNNNFCLHCDARGSYIPVEETLIMVIRRLIARRLKVRRPIIDNNLHDSRPYITLHNDFAFKDAISRVRNNGYCTVEEHDTTVVVRAFPEETIWISLSDTLKEKLMNNFRSFLMDIAS